jgi:biopolymer transport protein ExbB
MFKNTRLSAVLAAVLFSVTAASALVSAPAAAAPADAAAAPAADAAAAAPAAEGAAAPAAAGAKEEVKNPYGFQAMWEEGDFVNKGTIIILSLMSMGSWYIIITKLIDQSKIMRQSKEVSQKFWKANSIAAGSAALKEGSPFRFIAETGTKATQHHDGALLEQIDLSTWVTMQVQRAVDRVQSRLQDGLSFLATSVCRVTHRSTRLQVQSVKR